MEPLLLGLSGIATGLVTSLIGIRPKHEFGMWIALYVVWFLVLGEAATPMNLLIISILSGISHGATGAILVEQNMANNPWAAEDFEKLGDKVRQTMVMFSIGMGLMFGLLLAGIAWLLQCFG